MITVLANDYPTIDLDEVVKSGDTDAARNIVYAAIWIPYFNI